MAGKFYKLEEDGSILCNTTQECPDEVVDQVGNDIVDTGTTVVTTNKFLIPPSCRKTTLCRSSAAHPGVFKDKLYSNLSKTTPFNLKAFIHDIVMMFLDEHHEMQETFCSGQCTNVERMHPFDLMMYQNADES